MRLVSCESSALRSTQCAVSMVRSLLSEGFAPAGWIEQLDMLMTQVIRLVLRVLFLALAANTLVTDCWGIGIRVE